MVLMLNKISLGTFRTSVFDTVHTHSPN